MTTTTTSRTMNMKRRTSVLRFAGPYSPPDGEYVVRGGICWPIMDINAELMQGFALVCGRRVADGITYVLSERAFVSVDHVQDDAGGIQFEGLSTWFVDAWARWFAQVFAWKQPWETNRRYLLQVLRSDLIQPKPQFAELEWTDDRDARYIVDEAEAAGRLRYAAEGPLHLALMAYAVADDADRGKFAAVQALTCALHGLEEVTPMKKERP